MAGSRAFILSIRGCMALISFLLGSPMIFPMNCMVSILLLAGRGYCRFDSLVYLYLLGVFPLVDYKYFSLLYHTPVLPGLFQPRLPEIAEVTSQAEGKRTTVKYFPLA